MNTTGLLAGGAIIAVLTTCWSYVKSFLWRIISLFVQRVEIESEDVHYPVIWHMLDNYKMSPIYDKVYGGHFEHRIDGRYGLVGYEHFGKHLLVFWKPFWWFIKFPIFVVRIGTPQSNSNGNGGNDAGNGNSSVENGVFSTITILRWTVDLDEIICSACEYKNKLAWQVLDNFNGKQRRFFIRRIPEKIPDSTQENVENNQLAWYQRRHFRLLDEDPNNLGRRNPNRQSSLDQLIFPDHIKNLINEIKLWRISRKWYQDRGVPWKRGWNLYGPPGTGKTALARAFAEDLDLPLYVYNLAEVQGNMDFIKDWRAMQSQVPCIALIEDIDNVFHGRENITTPRRFGAMMAAAENNTAAENNNKDSSDDGGGRWGLTFDCLLNCIDGVERNDGVFLIMTTNDLSKIDPALGQPRTNKEGKVETISTRPGRIDKAIELCHMTNDNKATMAERIMGDYPNELGDMLKYIEDNPEEQETPAQFQERCSQIALARYWKELEEEEQLGNNGNGQSQHNRLMTKEAYARF